MVKARRTKAEWAELQARQEASGQCVKEWCTVNGVNINSMYNQNAKKRKERSQGDKQLTPKINELEDRKAVNTVVKPIAVEWKEVKLFPEAQRETNQRSSVYIEIGEMRLAADVGYPIVNLAALCKELLNTC